MTPQADYLKADDSVMDPSWRTIAATIRNEFHPAPVERSNPSTNAGAAPKAEADPTTGTARLRPGVAPHIVTETDADGAKVTSLVRQAPRVEEAPQNYQRRTFNPDGLHMDDYMAMRRQGLVPKVEVVGASRKTSTESFDLDAWRAWRAETTAKSEMEEFLEARSKGQVPAQLMRKE